MKKPPKIVWDVLRALVGIAVAAFLIGMVIRQNEVDLQKQFAESAVGWLVAAFGLYGVALFLTSWRWKQLLDVQEVDLSLWTMFRLTMIGVFFSLVIPGAVGGDLLKAVYIRKHARERTAEAILTIMLDRVFGLLGLMVVAVVAVLISLKLLLQAPWEIQGPTVFVGVSSFGGIVFVLAVRFRETLQQLPGIRQLLEFGDRKLPDTVTEIVSRFAKGLDIYRDKPIVLLKTLAISVIVHTCLAFVVYMLALAFHESVVAIRHYFLSMQVANTVGAIPLTPGGFGGRDYILAMFLEYAGASKEKAGIMAPTFTFVMIGWCLIGGIFFIFTRASIDEDDLKGADTPNGAEPSAFG